MLVSNVWDAWRKSFAPIREFLDGTSQRSFEFGQRVLSAVLSYGGEFRVTFCWPRWNWE